MQSSPIWTTITFGNHALTDAEVAAGVPPREPFVDGAGAPFTPDEALLELKDPNGVVRTFGYPVAGPTDAGVLTEESTGRLFVDWTPIDDEDGTWTWGLRGSATLGTGKSDKGACYVQPWPSTTGP